MSFVDIFFALLNFGILCGGIFYTAKKWMLPHIQQEIEADDKAQESLVLERNNLDLKLFAIDKEQDTRERWYRDLAQKVVVWKESVQRQRNFAQEEIRQTATMLQERREQQVILRTMERVQARVVPHAVAQARLELYDYYQESEAGNAFINDLIDDMRKRHGCSK